MSRLRIGTKGSKLQKLCRHACSLAMACATSRHGSADFYCRRHLLVCLYEIVALKRKSHGGSSLVDKPGWIIFCQNGM
jgi:hypothetical protein